MKSKASKQNNKFLRIITVPIRALSKARDLYVKSMSDYADRMNYGSVMAVPGTASQVSTLPKSFSVSSVRSNYDNEDFCELVRAASARRGGAPSDTAEIESYIKQQMKATAGSSSAAGSRGMLPRSSSVAMRRIDEDSPCCYFGEDNCISAKSDQIRFPRSRSHAVTARRLSAF